MPDEEAIKDIKENVKPVVGGISLDMAIEALQKQIPVKKYLKMLEICSFGSVRLVVQSGLKITCTNTVPIVGRDLICLYG